MLDLEVVEFEFTFVFLNYSLNCSHITNVSCLFFLFL